MKRESKAEITAVWSATGCEEKFKNVRDWGV